MPKENIPSDLAVSVDNKYLVELQLFENYNVSVIEFCNQIGHYFDNSAELHLLSAQMATNDMYKSEQSSKHYAIGIEYGSLQHTLRVISSNLADVLTQEIHMETDKHVLVHHKDVLSKVHMQLEQKRSRLSVLMELMRDANDGELVPTKHAHVQPKINATTGEELHPVCCQSFYHYQKRLYSKITRICDSTSDKKVIGTGSALIETLGVLETIVSLLHKQEQCSYLPIFVDEQIVDSENMDCEMQFEPYTVPKALTQEQINYINVLVGEIVVLDPVDVEVDVQPMKVPNVPRGQSYLDETCVEVHTLFENSHQEQQEHSKVLQARQAYLEDCLDVFGTFLNVRHGRSVLHDLNARVVPELSLRIDSVVGMLEKVSTSLRNVVSTLQQKKTLAGEQYIEAVKIRHRMQQLHVAYMDVKETLDRAGKRNAYLTVHLSDQVCILEHSKYVSAQRLHSVVKTAKAILEHYKIEYMPGAASGLIVGNNVNGGSSDQLDNRTAVLTKVGFSSVDGSVQEAAQVQLKLPLLWQNLVSQRRVEEQEVILASMMGSAIPQYPPHVSSFLQQEQVQTRLETVRNLLHRASDCQLRLEDEDLDTPKKYYMDDLNIRKDKADARLMEDHTSGKNILTHKMPLSLPLVFASHAMLVQSADSLARQCTTIKSQMLTVVPEPHRAVQHRVVISSAVYDTEKEESLRLSAPLCGLPQGIVPAFHALNYNAMDDHASVYTVPLLYNKQVHVVPEYISSADMRSTSSCSSANLVTISPLYLSILNATAPCTLCNSLMARYSNLSKTHHPFSLLHCTHTQSVTPIVPQMLIDAGMISGVEYFPHSNMPVITDQPPLYVTIHMTQGSDGKYSVNAQTTQTPDIKPASLLVNKPQFNNAHQGVQENAQLVVHLLPSSTNRFYSSTYIEAWLAEYDRLLQSHGLASDDFLFDVDNFISGVFPFPENDNVDEELMKLLKPLVTPEIPTVDKQHLKIVFTASRANLHAMYLDICRCLKTRRQLLEPFMFSQNQLIVPGLTHDATKVARVQKESPQSQVSSVGKATSMLGAQLPPYIDVVRVCRYLKLQSEQVRLQCDLRTHEAQISHKGVNLLVNKMRPKAQTQEETISTAAPSTLMNQVLNLWKFQRRHSSAQSVRKDWRKNPAMEELLSPSVDLVNSAYNNQDGQRFFIQTAMRDWFHSHSTGTPSSPENSIASSSSSVGFEEKTDKYISDNTSQSASETTSPVVVGSNLPTVRGTSHILPVSQIAKICGYTTRRAQRQVWVRKFSSVDEGSSFTKLSQALVTKCSGSIQSSVVLVRDETGRVFGGYNSKQWRQGVDLGTGESFVFTIEAGEIVVYSWKTTNNHFVQMRPTGIGWGGGGDVALWIDQDLHGHSGRSETYGNTTLSENPNFKIHCIEVWSQQSF